MNLSACAKESAGNSQLAHLGRTDRDIANADTRHLDGVGLNER